MLALPCEKDTSPKKTLSLRHWSLIFENVDTNQYSWIILFEMTQSLAMKCLCVHIRKNSMYTPLKPSRKLSSGIIRSILWLPWDSTVWFFRSHIASHFLLAHMETKRKISLLFGNTRFFIKGVVMKILFLHRLSRFLIQKNARNLIFWKNMIQWSK